MRLLNVLRRHRPDPLSPEIQTLHERAVALRWEIALLPIRTTRRERLELAGLERRMQECGRPGAADPRGARRSSVVVPKATGCTWGS